MISPQTISEKNNMAEPNKERLILKEAEAIYEQLRRYAELCPKEGSASIFDNPLFKQLTTQYLETKLCLSHISGISEGRSLEFKTIQEMQR